MKFFKLWILKKAWLIAYEEGDKIFNFAKTNKKQTSKLSKYYTCGNTLKEISLNIKN